MKPRYAADYRALFWALILFPALPLAHFFLPGLALWLLPASLYLAYCSGILTHHHNHCRLFSKAGANSAYSMWLSVFYGFPIFSWVPTHNQNHHRYLDGAGDVARTSLHACRPGLLAAITYPFFCSLRQAPLVRDYVVRRFRARARGRSDILLQSSAVLGVHAAFAILAIQQHGFGLGLQTYALALALPACVAPWSMMFTNYVQHAGCDASSADDHSRNFVDPVANWLTFESGFHSVHHEHPGAHWSRYPALHALRAARIDPALNQVSVVRFCLSTSGWAVRRAAQS